VPSSGEDSVILGGKFSKLGGSFAAKFIVILKHALNTASFWLTKASVNQPVLICCICR